MPMIPILGWLFRRLGYFGQHRMAETKLDYERFDEILKKNTSDLPNPLQGVSFSVFNNKGRSSALSAISLSMLGLSPAS